MLCVANLSRSVQPVELDLSALPRHDAGRDARARPSSRASASSRTSSASAPTPSTGSGCSCAAPAITRAHDAGTGGSRCTDAAGAAWSARCGRRCSTAPSGRSSSATCSCRSCSGSRGFRDRGRGRRASRTGACCAAAPNRSSSPIVEVEFDESAAEGAGPARQYFLPLSLASGERARRCRSVRRTRSLARITGARKGVVFDGWYDDRLRRALLEAVRAGRGGRSRPGAARCTPRSRCAISAAAARLRELAGLAARGPGWLVVDRRLRLPTDQHVTLKLFRRVEPGVHPEVEVTRHLTRCRLHARRRRSRRSSTTDWRRVTARGIDRDDPGVVESQVDGWTHAMDGSAASSIRSRRASCRRRRRRPLARAPPTAAGLATPAQERRRDGRLPRGRGVRSDGGRGDARRARHRLRRSCVRSRNRSAVDDRRRRVSGARLATGRARRCGALESGARRPACIRPAEEVAARDARRCSIAARDAAVGHGLGSAADLDAVGSKIRIHGDYRLATGAARRGRSVYIQNFEGHLVVAGGGAAREAVAAAGRRQHAALVQLRAHAALLTRTSARRPTSAAAARSLGAPVGDVDDGRVSPARICSTRTMPADAAGDDLRARLAAAILHAGSGAARARRRAEQPAGLGRHPGRAAFSSCSAGNRATGSSYRSMYVPVSTYRLQLHAGFPFAAADRGRRLSGAARRRRLLYVAVLRGDAGQHPRLRRLRPQRDQSRARRRGGARPLHRPAARRSASATSSTSCRTTWASDTAANLWWRDVLENGPARRPRASSTSTGRRSRAALHAKVLLPILGDQYGRVLERGELALEFRDGLLRRDATSSTSCRSTRSTCRASSGWRSDR